MKIENREKPTVELHADYIEALEHKMTVCVGTFPIARRGRVYKFGFDLTSRQRDLPELIWWDLPELMWWDQPELMWWNLPELMWRDLPELMWWDLPELMWWLVG